MRNWFIVLVISMFLAAAVVPVNAAGQGDVAQSPGMSFDQFRSMWEKEGTTPEGTVKCLLIAVLETVKENNPEGWKMWGLVLPKDDVDPGGEPAVRSHDFAREQFARVIKGTSFNGAIAASYLGGTPANKYAYSYGNNVVVDNRQTRRGDMETKLFVRSGGKDNSSPVALKKNNQGYWKVFEYSSLFTGVKPAVDPGDF